MENPLGGLPVSTSPQFTLDTVDWLKVLRMLLVQVIGLFLTLGVPYLLSFTYTWKGTDYTPYVLVVVNAATEAARRFVSVPPK